ncbi:carboxylesterase/lipase family protein [Roseateles sp. LKC17W]|uniref:Carboxylic ester hydrolase n=1 Tax=Pelomonas margarita TaxID=3299031 RepID=A0ABW7FI99_9BURK
MTLTRLPAPFSRRETPSGTVVGSREAAGTGGDVHAWRGLRYAAPPLGPLRWRAPQPAPRWQGELQALTHGAIAPQFAGRIAALPASQHGQATGDEDCLWLNVFAPVDVDGPLPVMVWIHGGGNAVGTAATFDVARNLAAQDRVIVVTVNYRLGVLGWFAHPALQAGADLGDEDRSGNFALLDLIAALRWVQSHIGAFGGDPGCVTIFGESAGGQQVLMLLASPLAAGLFHRAIAQSPVCESFSHEEAICGLDSPLDSHRCGGEEVVRRLLANAALPAPPPDLAAWLRSLSPAQLLAAHVPGSEGIYLTPRPVRDGVVLPLAPLPELFSQGTWNRVPVLLGSNRDEFRTFLAGKPEHCRLIGGKIPVLKDRAAYRFESGMMSRGWRAHHVDRPADAMLQGGHADVWTYRFDWDEAPAIPFIRPDILLGAAHAMEQAFAFRDLAGEFDIFQVNTPFNRAGRRALCDAMGSAWTTFARHGRPEMADGPAWPARRLKGADSLVFDTPRDGGLRMAALRESLATLQAELEQPSGQSPVQRLRCFARLFLWTPLLAGVVDAAAYERLRARLGRSEPAEAFRPVMEI